jgi:hypothetical protein
MKPHPRIRKAIKWGGAVVTVLLVVVWIGSGWCSVGMQVGDGRGVFVGDGQLEMCVFGSPDPDGDHASSTLVPGWHAGCRPFRLHWWFDHWQFGNLHHLILPLWVPAMITLLAAVITFRLDHGGQPNACPKCNYDRAGLAAGAKCPECGSAAP